MPKRNHAPRSTTQSGAEIISQRFDEAIRVASETDVIDPLIRLLERHGNMPGPRPNTDLSISLGERISGLGKASKPLTEALLGHEHPFANLTGMFALAASGSGTRPLKPVLARFHDLADEVELVKRTSVISALSHLIKARGDAAIEGLEPFMNGYLHAHVALESIAQKNVLERLTNGEHVRDRFAEAFELADISPRAAERLQGLRLLRDFFPGELARASIRFSLLLEWIAEQASRERPETRAVVSATFSMLRKQGLGHGKAQALFAALDKTAPLPRDPSRIVQGTRKRSKGRR